LYMDKGNLVMSFDVSKFTDTAYYNGIIKIKRINGLMYSQTPSMIAYDTNQRETYEDIPRSPKWELVLRDTYTSELFEYFGYTQPINPQKKSKRKGN